MKESTTISSQVTSFLSAVGAGFVMLCIVSVFIYFLVCLGTLAYMYMHPIVTAQDYKDSSWLISPSSALHFSGVLGSAIMLTMFVLGASLAIVKNSILPFLTSAIFIGSAFFVSDPIYLVEAGVNLNTIKIGCYVWETKDCQDMVGVVPPEQAFNKYGHDLANSNYSSQYEEAFKAATPITNQWAVALGSIPGGYFFVAPYIYWNRDITVHKLSQQRKDLDLFKKSHTLKMPG